MEPMELIWVEDAENKSIGKQGVALRRDLRQVCLSRSDVVVFTIALVAVQINTVGI
jgi:hypothetical protein